jgi:hypothetical protein
MKAARGSAAFVASTVVVAAWLSGSCVFPKTGIGEACARSGDCRSDLVCVLLDSEDSSSDAVCMPMLPIDEPVECTTIDDCLRAGYPVDADCAASRCSCDGLDSACSNLGFARDPITCVCALVGTCDEDADCAGRVCALGACSDGDTGDPCEDDADCPASFDRRCEAGSCR